MKINLNINGEQRTVEVSDGNSPLLWAIRDGADERQ